MIARLTFPTKRETAEGHEYHIYIPEQRVWRVARDPNSKEWLELVADLEAMQ